MAQDFYKTLGVARDASQADIQKAYRELARKHHPDLHPDDKTAKKKFQEVQAAFDVLNNPEKRELYDRYGSSFESMGAGPRGGPAGGGPQAGPGGFSFDGADFSQFFGDRFSGGMPGGMPGGAPGDFADLFNQFRRQSGGKTRRAAPRRGADLNSAVEIPFATAITGGQVQMSLQREDGHVETVAVKIPAGIEEGKKIRLRGQGEPAPKSGTPGDLLITVHVAPHPHFRRDGNNLTVRVPVTLGEAAAGAKVDLPTPSGVVSLRIPPGTSSGTKLRVKGHGVPTRGGTPGDLLAEVQIVVPKHLSDADRQTLAEIDSRYPQEPRSGLHW